MLNQLLIYKTSNLLKNNAHFSKKGRYALLTKLFFWSNRIGFAFTTSIESVSSYYTGKFLLIRTLNPKSSDNNTSLGESSSTTK